ncbi:MAG TPA: multiheme c-type cytochrome [Candidatus Brocadiia bacterium]|nr:hydrazine oxidoreductase HzoA [Planctomycetota bacterium]MDO8092087.1 multiheme c-type cytochrome [Candidatus Brocadiales bacterium]
MSKTLKVLLIIGVVGLGSFFASSGVVKKECQAVEIITHWVPHEVYGMPGEPDNSGKVFFSGLRAKYMGAPKDGPPWPGKYGKFYRTLPAYRYYIPDAMYNPDHLRPPNPIKGVFKLTECLGCHEVLTPGIVRDWKKSRHATVEPRPTGCDSCHGNNHQKLIMPSSKACGTEDCHEQQYNEQSQGGIGSHASCSSFAQVECAWSIERPPGDTAGCVFCHTSAEERCSTCHQRHQFEVGTARRSEQCKACHWGKDHRDWEAYDISIHGVVYQTNKWNKEEFDFDKKLADADYVGPTCQYCHMRGGHHNVQKLSTVYTSLTMSMVDRGAPIWAEKRAAWIAVCDDCHSPRFAREILQAMDESIKDASMKYRDMFQLAEDLYREGIAEPMPKDLAPDWSGQHIWALKIGAYHGKEFGGEEGESGEFRMSNCDNITRLCFEAVSYWQTYVAKGMMHMSWNDATYCDGSFGMDRWLVKAKEDSTKIRRLAALEKKVGITWVPEDYWKHGEWLDNLTGWKIVKEFPGKTIFDLCPEPGWLDTHHAPVEEVEYINRRLKELGMEAGKHTVHETEHHEEHH